jgi:excisionase family DNA binding protein
LIVASPTAQKTPDLSAWPTKQQAAELIGISTKFLEGLVKSKRIQQKMWRRPTGGPRVAVLHPGDCERERRKRNPDSPAFVLPPEPPSPPSKALVPQQPPDLMERFLALLAGSSQTTPTVRIAEKFTLSITEASALSGWPQAHLRRLIADEKLPATRTGAGWRIRRSDLRKL